MDQRNFLGRLSEGVKQVQLYEDTLLQEKARSVVPLGELREKASVALNRAEVEEDAEFRDQLVVELLSWFKHEFFSWFDKAHCSKCDVDMETTGYAEPTSEDLHHGAVRVESYRCKQCGSMARFPRYNNPAKLLETRTGRCGEWANCFTLLCRSLGYDTRYVLDWTDHVWTEIYSDLENRWIHCDACEAAFDKPLLYDAGWGKKLIYVIAFSKEEVQDVTWRYTTNHKEVLKRRNLVSESWLLRQTTLMTGRLQARLPAARRTLLTERLLRELCLLMTEPVVSTAELQGRISGDRTWRAARGELGPSGSCSLQGIVWKPTDREIETGEFLIQYSSAVDAYCRVSDGNAAIKGWKNGIFESSNVFRKVEYDWKKTYLARSENSNEGSLQWKFDLSDSRDLAILQISVSCPGDTFENGSLQWEVCTDLSSTPVPSGSKEFDVDAFGAKWCTLSVRLSSGASWQHAQVARQELGDESYPLMLRIYFGNFD